jgi:CRISPR system Cascade subunit CasC
MANSKKTVRVNFHLLRQFPYSNPNRDRQGEPKTGYFGGVQRGRVSSQCINKALRDTIRTEFADLCGEFTTQLPALIEEEVKKHPELADKASAIRGQISLLFGKDADTKTKTQFLFFDKTFVPTLASQIVKFKAALPDAYKAWLSEDAQRESVFVNAVNDLGFGDSSDAVIKAMNKLLKTKALIADMDVKSEQGIRDVVQKLHVMRTSDTAMFEKLMKGAKAGANNKTKNGADSKDLIKFLKANSPELFATTSLDCALQGRFVASDDFDSVVGAFTSAHMLAVNAFVKSTDFFTTIDTITGKSEHILGDDHRREFHSSLFYQYHCLDVNQLMANCAAVRNPTNLLTFLDFLVRTVYRTVPTALARKTATNTPPVAMLVEVILNGQPFMYMNAFDRLVLPAGGQDGLNAQAVNQLCQYAGRHMAEYYDAKVARVWLSPEFPNDCCYSDGNNQRTPLPDVWLAANSQQAAKMVSDIAATMLELSADNNQK